MLLVSGATATIRPLIHERPDIFGTLVTPNDGNALPEVGKWAADNSAFPGITSPRGFVESKFLRMLARHSYAKERCLFVAAPDVVGNHARTVSLWATWGERLKAEGWPVAFIGQNGATADALPWKTLDAVFLGGVPECLPCTYNAALHEKPVEVGRGRRKKLACPRCRRWLTEWKEGADAAHIAIEAQRRGKWVHMGRVNGSGRIRYASILGCDSADGSGYSKYAIDMLYKRGHAELYRTLAAQRRIAHFEMGEA